MGSLETWGTVAAIVLLLECMVGMVLVLAVAFGLWKGSEWVVNHIAQGFAWLDQQVQRGREMLVYYLGRAAAPFVKAHAALAGLRAAGRAVQAGNRGEGQEKARFPAQNS